MTKNKKFTDKQIEVIIREQLEKDTLEYRIFNEKDMQARVYYALRENYIHIKKGKKIIRLEPVFNYNNKKFIPDVVIFNSPKKPYIILELKCRLGPDWNKYNPLQTLRKDIAKLAELRKLTKVKRTAFAILLCDSTNAMQETIQSEIGTIKNGKVKPIVINMEEHEDWGSNTRNRYFNLLEKTQGKDGHTV